ncbi:STAS domain-containing protein [Anaerosalibacter sp. Marseille-P3206]|uniref:STAS domain-containing protein n=1 Tax=Anaerosalibacter sp. Marseille-P3206 TaxID=1871005 RepID=UPI0009875AAF|nr:STAS domain-containing protein [Anaerosalibacter sp. Marseille-P3206]
MNLDITVSFDHVKNAWVVKPVGEVDIYTSPKMKEVLTDSLKEKDVDILMDCDELEYVDSTGLGVLISILKRVRESGNDIIIVNLKQNIRKLFDITGLDKVFIIKE